MQTLFAEHKTSKTGLTAEEIQVRLGIYGENILKIKKKTSWIMQLLKQFMNLMVLILIVAGAVSYLAGEEKEAIAILIVVLLNTMIGFIQEFKAEKAVEALQKMMAPHTRVIRNGVEHIIESKFLVPGDIIILMEGDRIGADAILFEANELQTQEAALTGESVPVTKDIQNTELNQLFSGTLVAHGSGKAVVVKTGMETAFGRIAYLTTETKKGKSPLENELDDIGTFVGKITLVISGTLFLYGVFVQHTPMIKTLIFAASVAIAAVPEGLPTIVTIALALGAQRLAKKNAIVKQLSSVETLGSTRVILSDKTGTLTKNEMTVENIYVDNHNIAVDGVGYDPNGKLIIDAQTKTTLQSSLEWLAAIAGLCNNATLKFSEKNQNWEILGDPTEGAMLTFTEKTGYTKKILEKSYTRIHEIPFDSTRKCMSVIVENTKEKKQYSLVKGAPDNVINACTHILENGKKVEITDKIKEKILKENERMAMSALRVIGCAYKSLPKNSGKFTKESCETDLIFVGLIGMMDPPRPEVAAAVELTKKAGIKVYIVTGDHGLTAGAIAEKIGLVEKGYHIITGEKLNTMSEPELKKLLKNRSDIIFARVSPEHKLRIATTLKNLGEIIAVTGDGVNDAPALKKADIGIAMGITGTDVSKEAANMILADDSFSTIVAAIEEGRTIYENLKKFIYFIFSSNISEVFLIFISLLIGLPAPLSAILILLINLGTDVLPALALGIDTTEKGIMNLPPRNPEKRILEKPFIAYLSVTGCFIGAIVLCSYIWMLQSYGWTWGTQLADNDFIHIKASSFTFAVMVLIQMVHAYNSRSEYKSVFRMNPFNNWYLIGAAFISILSIVALIQLPEFANIVGTTGLTQNEWLAAGAIALLALIPCEIWKYFKRRKNAAIFAN